MDTQASAAPTSEIESAGPNQRPENISSLMCQGGVYEGWKFANKSKNRYYIVNLSHVMEALDIDYTRTGPYLDRAKEIILTQTAWPAEYTSDYKASFTQLSPKKIHEPKHFGRAAAIVVGMEVAATEKQSAINVYDWLRILPAQYFVDRFDAAKVAELDDCYNSWSEDERQTIFGDAARDRSFTELCLLSIGQEFSNGLLGELVGGCSITRYTADLLVEFTNKFPQRLHAGPVLGAGEDAVSKILGSKRAAPALNVPKRLAQEKLGTCR
jgi:hypothetical protein